jgi:DNA-3-methyladenine glycosylase II
MQQISEKLASTISLGDPVVFKRGLSHLKKNDPLLAALIDRHGIIPFSPEGEMFQSLVESILTQQLAWAAASAIIERVKTLYPGGVIGPAALYATPVSKLRKAGVSPQKIRYLKDLSRRVSKGKLDLDALKLGEDAGLLEALDEVLGIGPWTIHMLMIFTLGRPDVLPVDDLGIRKAIQSVYSLPEMPKKGDIETLAKKWHPYCSIASLYLWRHKDIDTKKQPEEKLNISGKKKKAK